MISIVRDRAMTVSRTVFEITNIAEISTIAPTNTSRYVNT